MTKEDSDCNNRYMPKEIVEKSEEFIADLREVLAVHIADLAADDTDMAVGRLGLAYQELINMFYFYYQFHPEDRSLLESEVFPNMHSRACDLARQLFWQERIN